MLASIRVGFDAQGSMASTYSFEVYANGTQWIGDGPRECEKAVDELTRAIRHKVMEWTGEGAGKGLEIRMWITVTRGEMGGIREECTTRAAIEVRRKVANDTGARRAVVSELKVMVEWAVSDWIGDAREPGG